MKYLRKRLAVLFTACITLCIQPSATACTDFRITAKDGTVLVTRSMEFSIPSNSSLRTSPRDRIFNTLAPDGTKGLSWKAKYGYVFLDGQHVDAAIDGMNEVGLSIEDLYLPNFAQYQSVPAGHNAQALGYIHFADWVLSNFKTVDEVRQAVPKIYVYTQKIPGFGDMVYPLHFSIYDASGKGIVVEYVGGKLHIYDSIGIMTNSPNYDWHVINLTNYLHLAPTNPPPFVANGITFAVNGQGFGMLGLPGDISPPSRFVKTAVLIRVAMPANNVTGLVNIAEHIINNVDIVLGEAREPESGRYISEFTQWVVLKDLTHKVFYYRTYNDLSLRSVALDRLNFEPKAARLEMPIERVPQPIDVTNQLLSSVQTH